MAVLFGTLPLAADYRINTFFRDRRGVYVNLYIPSTLKWKQSGAQISLTQKSGYPFEEQVEFEVSASRPTEFAIRFRVPLWTEGASVRVNGRRVAGGVVVGNFAAVERRWKTGDRIDVELPMKMRVEAVDVAHADTVVLMRGPLVLFPLGGSQPSVTREQLLAAKRTQAQVWEVATQGEIWCCCRLLRLMSSPTRHICVSFKRVETYTRRLLIVPLVCAAAVRRILLKVE